jgi:uncharacterized protein involved in outer membrane biogenesis
VEGSRPLRWVAIAAAAAVALVVAAAVVAYATIDTQAIARYAAAEVTRLTGRTIAARGPVTIALWPRLAVVANDVSISNPPGASRPELARVARVKGAIATWPLLRHRQVVAEGLELEGLDVVLETLPDGRGNWQFGTGADANSPAASPASDAAAAPFRLTGTFALVNAKIAWRPPGGASVDIVVPRLELAPQEGGRYALRSTIGVDAAAWTLNGAIGDPFLALRQRLPLDVDAKLAGGGVAIAAKGRVERRDSGPVAVLDLSLDWDAGSERMRAWSNELARENGHLSTRLDARDRRYTFESIAGTYGPSKFDGNATVDHGGKLPRFGGRVHVDAIDFARERPPAAALAVAGAAAGERASPLAALARFDADVDYVIDRVRLVNGTEATNLRGRVVVRKASSRSTRSTSRSREGAWTCISSADSATSQMHLVADGRGIELSRLIALPAGCAT